MGIQVAITLDDDIKPNYVVSTVLAASFLVTTTELILWVGNAWAGGAQEQIGGLRQCLQKIRENGTQTPLTTNQSYAKVAAPGLTKDVIGVFDAAAALPAETDVGVWYGSAFQSVIGGTVTPHVLRAIEKYLEATKDV